MSAKYIETKQPVEDYVRYAEALSHRTNLGVHAIEDNVVSRHRRRVCSCELKLDLLSKKGEGFHEGFEEIRGGDEVHIFAANGEANVGGGEGELDEADGEMGVLDVVNNGVDAGGVNWGGDESDDGAGGASNNINLTCHFRDNVGYCATHVVDDEVCEFMLMEARAHTVVVYVEVEQRTQTDVAGPSNDAYILCERPTYLQQQLPSRASVSERRTCETPDYTLLEDIHQSGTYMQRNLPNENFTLDFSQPPGDEATVYETMNSSSTNSSHGDSPGSEPPISMGEYDNTNLNGQVFIQDHARQNRNGLDGMNVNNDFIEPVRTTQQWDETEEFDAPCVNITTSIEANIPTELYEGQIFHTKEDLQSAINGWSIVQNVQSINSLKQIHSQVLISGLDQSRTIIDDLLVFLTEPLSGNIHYAFKLFDSLRNPYLFAFNLMIKALTKKGSHKNSILLFSRMREEKLSPDNFTYPFVLKAFGCLRLDSEGRKTHGLVSKSGFEFDPFVRNSLIDMYAELGDIKTARILFDEISQTDVVTWNVLIASYVKCREFEMAISFFKEMEKVGVKADEATLVSSI
ncbi:hypothetical protein M5K25_015745 [Dendrobium thyrsiflorum]|uniref:Pentatricopeptide repeat-containing protein n=1 Tax=Dendrobium thyrsiflorum TaxID=117978 RepID=A0ABD0UR33_DENTH